jgi:hypothetical protein
MAISRPLCLALAASALFTPTLAHAASVDFTWAFDLVAPFVETSLIALAAGAVGWLASRLGRRIGLEIDRDHAQALHEAIARGVRHALSLVRTEVQGQAHVDIESRLIAETAIYMEQLMPDALAYFGITDEALDRLIRAHLGPDVLRWTQTSANPS